MAEGKSSVIINAIILVCIVLANVTITFFVIKYLLEKSQKTLLEQSKATLEEKEKKKQELIKAKFTNSDSTQMVDEEGGETEEVLDTFEGYNTADYTNFPLEEIYANVEGRFVVITMILKYSNENEDLGEILTNALPDIRANILSLLRTEKIQDLEDVTYTRTLKNKIKKRVNQVIMNEEQEAGIDYVLFTQYIIE